MCLCEHSPLPLLSQGPSKDYIPFPPDPVLGCPQGQMYAVVQFHQLLGGMRVSHALYLGYGFFGRASELPEVLIAFFILIVKRIMSGPSPNAKNNSVFVCSSLCWLHPVQNSPVACRIDMRMFVFASQTTGNALKPQKVVSKSLLGYRTSSVSSLSLFSPTPVSVSLSLSPMYVCLSLCLCLPVCFSVSLCLSVSLTVFRLHIQTSDCIFNLRMTLNCCSFPLHLPRTKIISCLPAYPPSR